MKDMIGRVSKVIGFVTATVTADQDCTAIDLKGYQSCGVDVVVGNSADTLSGSVYFLLEMEHSDDNSTWTDCADADIRDAVTGTNTGTFAKIDAPAEDSAVFSVQYVGSKRYCRAVINAVGTHTNGTPIGVVNWKSQATYMPV
jgi:hypothetical protein